MNCPYISEAAHMCSVLVREVSLSRTWKNKQDAINAILDVRREEANMVSEWEHLHPHSQTLNGDADFIPDKV